MNIIHSFNQAIDGFLAALTAIAVGFLMRVSEALATILALFCVCLMLASPTYADTLSQRQQELEGSPGVGAGSVFVDTASAEAVPNFPAWEKIRVTYIYAAGDEVQINTIAIVVKDRGEAGEAAYYFPRAPSVIQPPEPVYMDGNENGPFTAAQANSFINQKWATVVTDPAPIQQLSLTRLDGLNVQVSGLFNVPGDQIPWQRRTYILSLESSTTAVNQMKFERVSTE